MARCLKAYNVVSLLLLIFISVLLVFGFVYRKYWDNESGEKISNMLEKFMKAKDMMTEEVKLTSMAINKWLRINFKYLSGTKHNSENTTPKSFN